MGFFQGIQERIRNSRGKRAISVRAIEVLLYIEYDSLKSDVNSNENDFVKKKKKKNLDERDHDPML